MPDRVALVVGASGLVGSNLLHQLCKQGGWRVIGVSRGTPHNNICAAHVSVDLLDPASCRSALGDLRDVTHAFFAVRAKAAGHAEMGARNEAMTRNVLDVLDRPGFSLQHVHLIQGTRWYVGPRGVELIPSREDHPRQTIANPYYAQHDHVTGRQPGRSWHWSSTRPCNIHGYSVGYPHNVVTLVGAFAAIARERGEPLWFPGSETGFGLLHSVIDVEVLCRAAIWIATSEVGRNQDFNISNGDLFSWANIWPHVADMFGMESGSVKTVRLTDAMADCGPVWDEIAKRYKLATTAIEDLVGWDYGDHLFNKTRADITSAIKLWRSGFHEFVDSEARFMQLLQQFRDARILP